MMPIFDLLINGENVSLIGPAAVVASKSNPGTYHVIYNGRCDCKGFEYRGRCRHLTTVTTLQAAANEVEAKRAERAKVIADFNRDCYGD